jgi:hemoglobin
MGVRWAKWTLAGVVIVGVGLGWGVADPDEPAGGRSDADAKRAGAPAAGEEERLRDLDARITLQLYYATLAGVAAFNQPRNDPATCAGIYQGALIVAQGMLEHRPQLQAFIAQELQRADAQANPVERARALRKVIEEVRAVLEKDLRAARMTLWGRLGGERVARELVREFLDAALADPRVDFTRGGKFPLDDDKRARLEQALVEMLSAVSGGPLAYKGKDMKTAHAGMEITDEQFDALAGHFLAALRKRRLAPADIEALGAAFAATRKDVVTAKKPAPPQEPPKPDQPKEPAIPVLQQLGGKDKLRQVLRDFLTAASQDPQVDLSRGGKFALDASALAWLEQSLTDYFAAALGGGELYHGRDLKTAHEGMQITQAQFDALAGHLRQALQKHQVPPQPARAVLRVLEQTRDAVVEKP